MIITIISKKEKRELYRIVKYFSIIKKLLRTARNDATKYAYFLLFRVKTPPKIYIYIFPKSKILFFDILLQHSNMREFQRKIEYKYINSM